MSQSVYSTSYLISPCFWPRNTHYKCPPTKTPCTSQKGKNSNPKSSQKLHKDQLIKYASTQKTLHDVYQNLEQIWILAFLHIGWFLLQKFWSCLHDTKNTRYLISLFCINKILFIWRWLLCRCGYLLLYQEQKGGRSRSYHFLDLSLVFQSFQKIV